MFWAVLFTSHKSVNTSKVNSQIRINNLQICDCAIFFFLEFFFCLVGWLGGGIGVFFVVVGWGVFFVCFSPITVACCSLL